MSGERNLTSFHLMKSSHRDDFKSRDNHSAYYTFFSDPPVTQDSVSSVRVAPLPRRQNARSRQWSAGTT